MRDFKLIRTRRRTLALQVRPDGTLTVRAPMKMPVSAIEGFVIAKQTWIERTIAKLLERKTRYPKTKLEKNEKRRHEENTFMALTLRSQHFAERMGVRYKSLGLSNAKGRWGSCTSDGRVRFSWRLALVPPAILDYVVIHELAHLREGNHSPAFWAIVEKFCPDYRAAKSWLKENQDRLTAVS